MRKRGAFSEEVVADGSDLELREEAAGQVLVVVRGSLDFRTAKGIRERLTGRLSGRAINSLTIDMSAVGRGDTFGLVVLHELKEGDWGLASKSNLQNEILRHLIHQQALHPHNLPHTARIPNQAVLDC